MIRAAIFDVDGTLVDSNDLHARAWQDALRDFGHEVALADLRLQIGKGGDQLLPVFLDPEELAARGESLEKHRSQLFRERYLPQVQPFSRVRALFERLRADGIRTALASSAKFDEIEHHTRLLGIGDLLDAQTSSDDAERSKPYPDIFRAALDRLEGVDPPQAAVIGDTPYDAQAAGQLGVRVIGLLSGGFAEPALREAGCVEVYRDASDLLDRYGQSLLGRERQAA